MVDRMSHSEFVNSSNMKAILRFSVLVICAVSIATADDIKPSRFAALQPRIVGGQRAADGQFPYQVSLRKVVNGRHMCGASIISQNFLLTAAHCTQSKNPEDLYAVVGTVNPNANTGIKYSLDKITPHEHFDPHSIFNDISLLRTTKKIAFNEYIQPIALPTKDTGANVQAFISGWGITAVNLLRQSIR